ncbi:MAG: hypothetical protein RJA44_1335 [Pseudomonadota bacterium]
MSLDATAKPQHYYSGLNQKLLQAIPADARHVLELGCANGLLGRRCKELNPQLRWWGVDIAPDAVAEAAQHLDRALLLDLDRDSLLELGQRFDTIVIGDLLEHLREPQRLLEALYDLGTHGARIICCLPNSGHLSVLTRLLGGDLSYDAMGLLDRTHLRFYSPASAFKLFLDSGWLPDLVDAHRVEPPADALTAHLVAAAEQLGVPAGTTLNQLGLYQMIIVARKWSMQALLAGGPRAPFSVIVPVNRPWQHELNIARSPGLQEVGADVVVVERAGSAAEAYALGAAQARHPWRILAHQDVYFPTGSGYAIAQQLGQLDAAGQTRWPAGFAGLCAHDGAGAAVSHTGMVIDRQSLFDHPVGLPALSIDEFAVALHRDCAVGIDASLGWHLWATDLCLQATAAHGAPVVPVLQAPLFHNSSNDYSLPDAFRVSADLLLAKHPALQHIPTLCGLISRPAAA